MTRLVECVDGDLRKSVTYLQTAHCLKGDKGINRDDVLEITGVSQLLHACSCLPFLFNNIAAVVPVAWLRECDCWPYP